MIRLKDDCPDEIFEIGFSLNMLAYDEPEKAWDAINIIIKGMDRKSLIEDGENDLRNLAANLGAGPLETLLVQHGSEYISKIEDEALTDDRMAWIVGCVWKSSIPDEIWTRIQKAAGGISR